MLGIETGLTVHNVCTLTLDYLSALRVNILLFLIYFWCEVTPNSAQRLFL